MTQSYKITVEELCMKLKPVFGKKMDELYLKYAMAETREEKEEIERILNVLYNKHLSELLDKKVLLEPPKKEAMNGDYPLALVSYADKKLHSFNLREQDWIRHVCISGMSGSGKTTMAFHIVDNFIKKDKPFLIFDWKKSFRPLLLVDGGIMLFTVGNENTSNLFKVNLNHPPEGVPPKEWINVLCDLITESFFASYGVHKILLETLDEAFKDFGVYNNSQNYPTWNEIKWRLETRLEKAKGRTATWLESALRITHVLTFGNFGKAINYKGKDSLTIDDLLDKKVIFELNSLGNIEKKFFCELLLTYIYKLKKASQNKINQGFDYAILVDEAHNIFLKEKTHFVKESVTDVIYREMREYGTALICLDQHISKISDTVVGNSACHIAFQQQLPQDIEAISGLMQLRDRKQYFSMLPVGTAIVKLSERYTQPFLVEVLEVELRGREVADEDIKNRMKFIFEGKKIIESGYEDSEFAEALLGEKEKPRMPNHAVFNGEVEEFEALDTAIGKDYSFKNLDKLQEIPRNLRLDVQKSEELEAAEEPEAKELGITGEKVPELKIKEHDIAEKIEDKFEESAAELAGLADIQKILYEFVEKKLAMGWNIREIERILEEHTVEGDYSIADVFKVINYTLKSYLGVVGADKGAPESVTTFKKQNIYKDEGDICESKANKEINKSVPGWGIQDKEQERFLAFLRVNPNHDYSTIEIYKKLGLSTRKGNKIKNELLDNKLIKIEEQKNNKGWKKIITPA